MESARYVLTLTLMRVRAREERYNGRWAMRRCGWWDWWDRRLCGYVLRDRSYGVQGTAERDWDDSDGQEIDYTAVVNKTLLTVFTTV